MSINVVCPTGHQLHIEDQYAGKRIHCPSCQAIVLVPSTVLPPPLAVQAADVPPPPSSGHEAADRTNGVEPGPRQAKRQRRERLPALGRVRLGVTFHLAKMIGILAGVAYVLLQMLVVEHTEYTLAPPWSESRWLFAGLAVVIYGLGILGSALCLAVPRASGARWLIGASLLTDLVQIAIALLYSLGVLSGLRPPAILVGQGVVLCASWILFMMFLRTLAAYLQKTSLLRQAEGVLKFGVCVWLAGFLVLFMNLSNSPLGLVSLLALVPAWVVFLMRYAQLLLAARRVIP